MSTMATPQVAMVPPFAVRVTAAPVAPHDPLALYSSLVEKAGNDEAFLFESLAGPREDCRSTVVGYGRLAEIRLFADHIEISGLTPLRAALLVAAEELGMTGMPGAPDVDRASVAFPSADRAWELLRRAQGMFAVETDIPDTDYAFGFLTSLAYEAVWHMEELPARDTSHGVPDVTLTLFRGTVWYDERAKTARHLAADSRAFPLPDQPDISALAAAAARESGPADRPGDCPEAPVPRSVLDTVRRETFLDWTRRCLEHIRVGDIYQIQIGHRVDVVTDLTPVEVYRRLRFRNPSPYMYLAPHADGMLIGASPELFFRTQGDKIVMRPIAGTTRRTDSAEENARRVKEMTASTKEQAEHVMLVDLCRNDIGRVCRPDTLSVDDFMTVETFSHVFHLVSTVSGRPAPEADPWRVLAATFPAGTMTGAPKIRAMEIISGIEQETRGVYAGAIGLIDVRGWSELALCIRTIVHDGGTYSTQSSAGIVAQSSPEAEWDETLAKMGAAYWALTGEELLG